MFIGQIRLFAGAIVLSISLMAPASAADGANPDATGLLRANRYQALNDHYSEVQHQFDTGKISGDQLRDAFRAFYPTDADLAAHFDGWISAYPTSYVARVARGIYYKRLGLQERGTNYIAQTSDIQIRKMDDALSKAASDLGASIALDPKPFLSYLHTMDIGRQYISNEQLRKVFDQGAKLDPTSSSLRIKFMTSLEPKWGGSLTAMRAFLEESKKANLTEPNMRELESMVYETEGFQYHASGNLTGAEAAYRKAIQLGGNCLCAHNELVKILFETRQYAAAITLLDDYLEQKPGDLWALANRGVAKLNANQAKDAIMDLQQAAEQGDSYSQDHLGMLYLNGAPGAVEADFSKSVYWLRKASDQGEAEATANLPRAQALAAHAPVAR